jgi:hypothetical protein
VTSMAVRVVKPEHLDSTTGSVVDVKKDGKEVGEIVFTGNICAKGYYRDSEATRKLWEGGVNHSGDLAVWEPDGSVKIIDRGKDIIISGKFYDLCCGRSKENSWRIISMSSSLPQGILVSRSAMSTSKASCLSIDDTLTSTTEAS